MDKQLKKSYKQGIKDTLLVATAFVSYLVIFILALI